jgi:hypothetical protein
MMQSPVPVGRARPRAADRAVAQSVWNQEVTECSLVP